MSPQIAREDMIRRMGLALRALDLAGLLASATERHACYRAAGFGGAEIAAHDTVVLQLERTRRALFTHQIRRAA